MKMNVAVHELLILMYPRPVNIGPTPRKSTYGMARIVMRMMQITSSWFIGLLWYQWNEQEAMCPMSQSIYLNAKRPTPLGM
jgi:hypothetical protein